MNFRPNMIALCTAVACSTMMASELVWQFAPQSSVWSTTAPNWNSGEAWPYGSDHLAVFSASIEQDITVGEPLTIGGIRFESDGYRVSGDGLIFGGASPFINVSSTFTTSLLENAIFNHTTLRKSGDGVLRLGAAPYHGETNINDLVIAEGALSLEDGRSLTTDGAWSVAGGASFQQSGGTNITLRGETILVVGDGGAGEARFEVTGGVWHAKTRRTDYSENSRVVLGRESDAWFRVAGDGDVWAVVIETIELEPGRSATLQLDGGKLTVARITGSNGVSDTSSRILLNGTEIISERGNSAFIENMTEALIQGGGLVVNIPTSYMKTQQFLQHDPLLGDTLDGGVAKYGTGALHLMNSNTYTGTNMVYQGSLIAEKDDALGFGPVVIGFDQSASLGADTRSVTLTNHVVCGVYGSFCAGENATLNLSEIIFTADFKQLRIGSGAVKGGTVRLRTPNTSYNLNRLIFYNPHTLVLDGGVRVLVGDPATNLSQMVEVRDGCTMTINDAEIRMTDNVAYLNLGAGRYHQADGVSFLTYAQAITNDNNPAPAPLPAQIMVDGGSLEFSADTIFSASSRRSTEIILNGGTLKAKQVNLSKPAIGYQDVYHLIELNGGTLEAESIQYNTNLGQIEPAVIRFNGGTLKSARESAGATDFISANIPAGLSLRLAEGGMRFDSNGADTSINQPLEPDGELGAQTPDGGIHKSGAGSLTISAPATTTGPITVEEGELALYSLNQTNASVTVAENATLTLSGGSFSNVSFSVADGGTLRFLTSADSGPELVGNGSFENHSLGSNLNYKYLTADSQDVPGWSFEPDANNQVGIQKNGGAFTTTEPWTTNGVVTAMIKYGTVKTEVTVPQTGLYALRFEHSMRYGQTTAPKVLVKVDDAVVHSIVYPGYPHPFEQVECVMLLARGTHEIAFQGLATGNPAVFIDAVSLTRRESEITVDKSTALHLAPGATLVMDNKTPVYFENIYMGTQRIYNIGLLEQHGVVMEGNGRLKTAPGGTTLLIR